MNATIRRSVIVVLALGLAGCDLFKPETPEPPGGNVLPPVVELDYSSAEQTLTTIAAAIKAKDLGNGHRAFILAFADAELDSVPAYTASFDTADVNDFLLSTGRDSIETWTRDREGAFYTQFSNLRRSAYVMQWDRWLEAGNDEIDDVAGLATLHRHYHVYAQSGDASILIGVGLADIHFQRSPRGGDTEKWVITRWDDHIDPAQGEDPIENITFGARRLKTLR
jgi:hypothetical protein